LARRSQTPIFATSGDDEGRVLLPFYTAYSAAVRGKVEGMKLLDLEVSQAERDAALIQARGHWLLALGELAEAESRPCLVLVGGLPGVGKSTLVRELAVRASFTIIRSDHVRKEQAGLTFAQPAASAFETGLYTPELTERTYGECLRRAESLLFEGGRVLVDASFSSEVHRRLFLESARRWCVPFHLIVCTADSEVVHDRLLRRQGDASDADWSIYVKAKNRWEIPGPAMTQVVSWVETGTSLEAGVARALEKLRATGMVSSTGE
jgi:predicted kinase